jgi:hypothetical protein
VLVVVVWIELQRHTFSSSRASERSALGVYG